MLDSKHYVPILKFKSAEVAALKLLPDGIKDKITPVLEIDPPSGDDSITPEDVTRGCEKTISNISDSFGNRPFFIDLWQFDDNLVTGSGEHPLIWIFNEIKARGLKGIPVIGIGRAEAYESAVETLCKQGHDLCIRLEVADLPFRPEGTLSRLIEKMKVPVKQLHLLFDYEGIDEERYSLIKLAVNTLRISIPAISEWASFIIAGSAFPKSMGEVGKGHQFVSRLEWALYKEVISEEGRPPTFGDYGINHFAPLEGFDPVTMQMSANIRYTVENDWLILKGSSVKKLGYSQYHELSAKLVSMSEYKGKDYSWGDNYISQCADRTVKSGNATIWRKVGTSHHITFVVNQVASLFET